MGRTARMRVVTLAGRPAHKHRPRGDKQDMKARELTKGLNDIGPSEGVTFDRLRLDRVIQELTRQYNNRGKYNVVITPTVTRLDRNRVDVNIDIKEGKAASIRHINLDRKSTRLNSSH